MQKLQYFFQFHARWVHCLFFGMALMTFPVWSQDENELKAKLQTAENLFQQAFTQKTEAAQETMYLDARKVLISLTESHPENAQVFAQLAQVTGKLALFRGNREKIVLGKEVKGDADRALKLDPMSALAHAVLGVWHFELSELGSLERFFGKIIYGSIPEGDLTEARKHLDKAIELEPKTVFFRLALGKILNKQGNKKEAEKQLKIGLELPDSVLSDPYTKKDIKAFQDDL